MQVIGHYVQNYKFKVAYVVRLPYCYFHHVTQLTD